MYKLEYECVNLTNTLGTESSFKFYTNLLFSSFNDIVAVIGNKLIVLYLNSYSISMCKISKSSTTYKLRYSLINISWQMF